MKKLLTSIVLAGALAFGVGGCREEPKPTGIYDEACVVEFETDDRRVVEFEGEETFVCRGYTGTQVSDWKNIKNNRNYTGGSPSIYLETSDGGVLGRKHCKSCPPGRAMYDINAPGGISFDKDGKELFNYAVHTPGRDKLRYALLKKCEELLEQKCGLDF